MNFLILFLGFAFGAILRYARLNKYNVISGMATLENFAVAKAISTALGAGIIIIALENATGLAGFHLKPILTGGIIIGGLIFGTGMAILGYCPGTLPVSLGEGSLDALPGITGGLAGGFIYTLLLTLFQQVIGPDLGSISLYTLLGHNSIPYFLIVILSGGLFVVAAFLINKYEKATDHKWLISGIALAALNGIVFLTPVANRPIGASTTYPYVADLITGLTNNSYFTRISGPGRWELIFLSGAFLAGLVLSLISKEFKLTLLHSNWIRYKGNSAAKRILWSFFGGFILIIGARMAGGCTSGHIISGGMQLSFSSLLFAIFVFAGLLLTGKYFYKK